MRDGVAVTTAIRNAVRYGYIPFMLLGINGLAAYLAAQGASKLWLVGLIAAAVGCSFAAERVLPYRDDWNSPMEDAGRDTAHALVNETLVLSSVAIIPFLAAVTPFPSW